jgi:alcohol dehydrogenase class IV
VQVSVYDQVTPNPRDNEVMAGAIEFKREKCDGLLALGGGSPMDCAKGIGIVVSNEGSILDYAGIDMIPVPIPPMICIPTTAGSASDVSQFSIILDSVRKVKIAIVSKAIIPDVSLIDPETTDTMDPYLTACTGMDALVHAIEAYVSLGSSFLSDVHAIKAIELLAGYLEARMEDPGNVTARDNIMYASTHAGLAFSNAILGAVHAMAHSLGGYLDLNHGECNAILLDHVVGINYDSAPERYDRVGKALGLTYEDGNMSLDYKRELLVAGIRRLKKKLEITAGLRDVGVERKDIPVLAATALKDPCLITNPRKLTLKDLESIYERAF